MVFSHAVVGKTRFLLIRRAYVDMHFSDKKFGTLGVVWCAPLGHIDSLFRDF